MPFCSLYVAQTDFKVVQLERARVLKAANGFLKEAPITITASDFFSKGNYWWPDPQTPNGPYIQRDGMSNPNNFVDHRRYLMRLSVQVPALVAAWRLTKDARYAPAVTTKVLPEVYQ